MKFPDKDWLNNICCVGQAGKCCRYLMCGSKGWECAKEHPSFKAQIDERVKNGQFSAKGDNCDGPSAPPKVLN